VRGGNSAAESMIECCRCRYPSVLPRWLQVLFPSSYASTARQVLPLSGAATAALDAAAESLRAAAAADPEFSRLSGGLRLLMRTKSLYSVMRKLLRLEDPAAGSRRLGQLYDLLGLRAVVLPRPAPAGDAAAAAVAEADAVAACYRLQALAHALWAPLPSRSKDYVAAPKPNGYRSLHSTLCISQPSASQLVQQEAPEALLQQSSTLAGGESTTASDSMQLSYMELQIRTTAMHAAAEGGDAAHAGYKGLLQQQQVRHLQAWTAQLRGRLSAPQQPQLLLGSASAAGPADAGAALVDEDMADVTSDSDGEGLAVQPPSLGVEAAQQALEIEQLQQKQQQHVQAQLQQQAAAAAALFRDLDLDGDGQLSLYELSALLAELAEPGATPLPAPQPVHQQQQQQQQQVAASMGSEARAVLEALDADGDGLISMQEFLNYYVSNTISNTLPVARPTVEEPAAEAGAESLCAQEAAAALQTAPVPPAPAAPAAAAAVGGSSSSGGRLFHGAALQQRWQRRRLRSLSWAPGGLTGAAPRMRQVPRCSCVCAATGASSGTNTAMAQAAAVNEPESGLLDSSSSSLATARSSAHDSEVGAAAADYDDGSVSAAPAGRMRRSSSFTPVPPVVAAGQQQQQQPLQPLMLAQSMEEEEQLQSVRRAQRQLARRGPTLLQMAAAGNLPEYELVPLLLPEAAGAWPGMQQQQQQTEPRQQQQQQEQEQEWRGATATLPPQPLLEDRLGRPLHALAIGAPGPTLLTNAPRIFSSAGAVLRAETPAAERLALWLELVLPPPGSGGGPPRLLARNVSRVARGRGVGNAAFLRNGGTDSPLLPHRGTVELQTGDVLSFGDSGVALRVELRSRAAAAGGSGGSDAHGHHPAGSGVGGGGAPADSSCAVASALRTFCGGYARRRLGLSLAVDPALQELALHRMRLLATTAAAVHGSTAQQQQQQQQPLSADSSTVERRGGAAAAAAVDVGDAGDAEALEAQLRGLSRLAAGDPLAAERELAALAVAHPASPGPWFVWAQLALSRRRSWMARELFRAAAITQQLQLDAAAAATAAAAAAVSGTGSSSSGGGGGAVQPGGGRKDDAAHRPLLDGDDDASHQATPPQEPQPGPLPLGPASPAGARLRAAVAGVARAGGQQPARRSARLVQVLRVWARAEWDAGLLGPARRLWRAAANEALSHPPDLAAMGGGAVLRAWAAAEFEADNVLNARVIIGEALRKCPHDAAVRTQSSCTHAPAATAHGGLWLSFG
jgi:ppGpp synthetase/RelA/SpoT-type nucleotidyltranferase